jgi:enoyl-CoA hydratase/carnithine racemase
MTEINSTEANALLAIEGPVATITLNRPEAFNAINLALAKRLETLARQLETDPAVSVVVIEGNGKAFCAGGDIRNFGNLDNVHTVVREMLTPYHAFIATLRRMPQLVLTSVHGAAAGAGMSLAFMGDLCIAADTARFTPGYAKLGVAPDGGGTVAVVPAIGSRRALQLFLAEDDVSAQQAATWGLVTKVVAADSLKAETRAFAARLARNSRSAIAETKRLIHSPAASVEAQLDAEMNAVLRCLKTETFVNAINAFVARSKA